jgi:hypothetical protein
MNNWLEKGEIVWLVIDQNEFADYNEVSERLIYTKDLAVFEAAAGKQALDVKAARLAGETIIGDAEEAGYVSEELVADICDEDDNIIGHVQRAKMGTGFIYVH